MDKILVQQIKKAEANGWKLCAGCKLKFIDSPLCQFCPISHRKLMGMPPRKQRRRNVKKLLNEYRKLWREMPGAMIVVHFAIVGGVIVAVLLARGIVAGLVALIAWLLILAAIAKPCLMIDLMRD